MHHSLYRKLGTAILTSFTAFHVVFQVDYGDQEHAFTDIQKWYKRKVDDILIGKDRQGQINGPNHNSSKFKRSNDQNR